MLGLPLLMLWLPAVNLGWLTNEALVRSMLVMFLGMYGAGAFSAFRRHHRWEPVALAAVGGSLVVGTTWHALPRVVGWIALGVFTTAWIWDMRLLRHCHER
jgi:hypothetical protein